MSHDADPRNDDIEFRIAVELAKVVKDAARELVAAKKGFIDEHQLLIPAELANMLGVPESWVLEKARLGEIPSLKLGTYRRFHPPTIEQWLRDNHENGALGSVRRSAS